LGTGSNSTIWGTENTDAVDFNVTTAALKGIGCNIAIF
jgi:hypothetical protein